MFRRTKQKKWGIKKKERKNKNQGNYSSLEEEKIKHKQWEYMILAKPDFEGNLHLPSLV